MKIRNRENLLLQAIWGGAFSAYVVFAIPYLVRLDASITLISIYVAMTSLGQLVIGPIVIIHLQGSKHKKRWLVVAGVLSRFGVFVAAFAPLFGDYKAQFAAAVFILFSIPNIVFGALWTPVPGLTIAIDDQPKIISNRIRLANAGGMSANILFAIGMFTIPFPSNFVYVFVLSGILGALEIITISRIHVYDTDEVEKEPFLSKFKGQQLGKEKDYFIFIGGVGLAIAAVAVASPLQSVYFLQELKLSDRWLSMWAVLLNFGAVIGITIWKRVQKRVGVYAIFSSTIVIASFYFLILATVPNKYLLLVAILCAGIINSGTDFGITMSLYRLGSEERRDLLINLYIGVTLGIAFIAALFLNFFTDRFALTSIFLGSFAIRFVIAFFFRLPSMKTRFADSPGTNIVQSREAMQNA